jgi:hypothetical protein
VTAADIAVIKLEVEQAILRNIKTGPEFQKQLKQKLSQEYHRNSFTVAFNNQKRLITQKINNGSLSSIASVSNDSKSLNSLHETPEIPKAELFPDLFEIQNDIMDLDYLLI